MSLNRVVGFSRPRFGPLRAVGLGDSITQNNSYETPNGLWQQGNGYFETLIRRQSFADAPDYVFVANAGIAGNTTPQMLARLQTDVLSHNPDVVFLMCGTNDILSGATTADYQVWLNAMESIIVQLQQAGVDVVLATPPAKDGAPAEVAYAIPFVYMMAEHYGLPLIDAFRCTVDPTTTGSYLSGYSSDGTHPNATGIAAIVNEGIAVLSGNSGSRRAYRGAVSNTAAGGIQNLIQNGTFANVTVPPAPDYWGINITNGTFSLTASGAPSTAYQPFVGNMFNYTLTTAAGSYALFGTAASSGYADGDVLVFSGVAEASGLTGAAAGFSVIGDFSADQLLPFNSMPYNGLYEFSQEFVVPAGFSSNPLTPEVYVQDLGTYNFAEITIWNKSAYAAIWTPGLSIYQGLV